MVKEYLEKHLDELLEKRIQSENEYSHLENKIRENIEFINLLEEKNDPNYESFTPRLVHSANKKKIEELKEEQKEIITAANLKKIQVNSYYAKVQELNDVIKAARKSEIEGIDFINRNRKENEIKDVMDRLYNSSLKNFVGLDHKIDLCIKLMDIDSSRSKMELTSISNCITNTMKEVQELANILDLIFANQEVNIDIGGNYDRKTEVD